MGKRIVTDDDGNTWEFEVPLQPGDYVYVATFAGLIKAIVVGVYRETVGYRFLRNDGLISGENYSWPDVVTLINPV